MGVLCPEQGPFPHCEVCGLQTRQHRQLNREIQEIVMTLTTLLVILLVLVLIGALPVYPYSSGWGCYPSGILAVVVAVVALMLL
jgi:hypothetical protein